MNRLKLEIQESIHLFKLRTLNEAYALSRLKDATLDVLKGSGGLHKASIPLGDGSHSLIPMITPQSKDKGVILETLQSKSKEAMNFANYDASAAYSRQFQSAEIVDTNENVLMVVNNSVKEVTED